MFSGIIGKFFERVYDYIKKGEKQLLCLGRSLLSKAKIVLIDEATSSIDLDTETKIHKIIQENFQDVTVLGTHHQNTVTDAYSQGLSGVRDRPLNSVLIM